MEPFPVDECLSPLSGKFQKFDSSIHLILNQVHPDLELSKESYPIINQIINYLIKLISINENLNFEQLDNIIYNEFPKEYAYRIIHLHSVNYNGLSKIQVKKAMKLIAVVPKNKGVMVFITILCEYIIGNILDLAGNYVLNNKKIRIKPKHILIAIITDNDLDKIFHKVIPVKFSIIIPDIKNLKLNI